MIMLMFTSICGSERCCALLIWSGCGVHVREGAGRKERRAADRGACGKRDARRRRGEADGRKAARHGAGVGVETEGEGAVVGVEGRQRRPGAWLLRRRNQRQIGQPTAKHDQCSISSMVVPAAINLAPL